MEIQRQEGFVANPRCQIDTNFAHAYKHITAGLLWHVQNVITITDL